MLVHVHMEGGFNESRPGCGITTYRYYKHLTMLYTIGLDKLCQHNFENNRYLKA